MGTSGVEAMLPARHVQDFFTGNRHGLTSIKQHQEQQQHNKTTQQTQWTRRPTHKRKQAEEFISFLGGLEWGNFGGDKIEGGEWDWYEE